MFEEKKTRNFIDEILQKLLFEISRRHLLNQSLCEVHFGEINKQSLMRAWLIYLRKDYN